MSERAKTAADQLRSCSPVAARLVEASPGLTRFLDRPPPLGGMARVPATSARRCLRLLRKRALVHTAWQELVEGASPLVTARLWSDVADACIALADRVAFDETAKKLGAIAPGRAVLALGKLGSRELNPSSDVDIVCVYRSDQRALPEQAGEDVVSATGVAAHEWFTGWARRLRSILADVDDDGFCFRVDFDLRPEGTRGPLVNSIDAVESYYERFGRTWERAALLRLRPVVDVDGAGSLLIKRLQPFVFKKSVDARVVDELFAMKAQVTSSSEQPGVFDVKRGRGGIREVEFIAQSLQLLHGGRLRGLQWPERPGNGKSGPLDTATTLLALDDLGLLPHSTAQMLVHGYELLRRVEHALQLGEDRQTQDLPTVGPEHDRTAAAVGRALQRPGVVVRFDAALEAVRHDVHDAFVRHLGEARAEAPESVRLALDPAADDDQRQRALLDAGFVDSARALTLLQQVERRRGSLLSPSSLRDLPVRRFVERLLEHIGRSVDPAAALERLPDVFATRPHPAVLEKLDERSVAVVARVLALSAPLSRSLARLARRGGVDDALLFGLRSRRSSAPALDRLLRQPGNDSVVDGDGDAAGSSDEGRLGFFSRIQQELVFAAALPFLAGRIGVIDAQHRLSALADALLRAAVDVAQARMTRRHGSVPGLRFSVLALGSLGGRELGFFRDLDLAFVYDADEDVSSSGTRAVGAQEWATRMAQQVLWVLTAPLDGAALYPVDTRLRPSGNQGALTTSLSRFSAYHQQESALWERQSLLRLRAVAGDRALGRAVVDVVRTSLRREPPVGLGLRLLDMRARMVEERAASGGNGGLDIKLGDGGMADVEFAVQGCQLFHARADGAVLLTSTRRALSRLRRQGHIPAPEAAQLRASLDVLVQVREALALVDDAKGAAVLRSDARLDKLARSGSLPGARDGDAAWQKLATAMAVVRDVSSRILMRLA